MKEASEKLNNIIDKLNRLLEKHIALEEENLKLKEEIATVKLQVSQMEETGKVKGISKSLLNEGGSNAMKEKINEYIREIDNCIAALNEN